MDKYLIDDELIKSIRSVFLLRILSVNDPLGEKIFADLEKEVNAGPIDMSDEAMQSAEEIYLAKSLYIEEDIYTQDVYIDGFRDGWQYLRDKMEGKL